MSQIINIFSDPHRSARELLPWYVTGNLDDKDRVAVEAHLSCCTECREELAIEQALSSEIVALPWDAEFGWNRLHHGIIHMPPRQRSFVRAGAWLRRALAWPGRFGWLLAGQVALAGVVVAMILPGSNSSPGHPALYRTLGTSAASGSATGNIIVIFRPDSREEDLRHILDGAHARLVDGPTAAGAYLLHVAAAERDAVVASLQTQPSVVLAQPMDAGVHP